MRASAQVAGVPVFGQFRPESWGLAWIYTAKTRVFFYGTVPADDMPQFQYRFDAILDTATLN